MIKKISTLCIPHFDRKVLLGMKKRDFGIGRWNGFGGKVKPNETLEDCARRELLEEAGIIAEKIEKVGKNIFEYEGKDEVWEVHIYKILKFKGEPHESDEMKPKWFLEKDIPFSEMWPDDIFWMPKFLAGKKFQGNFLCLGYDKVTEYSFKEDAADL